MNRRALGDAAERRAAEYLQRHGVRLLTRNYSCRGGEIDIVGQDGAIVVFVEVRLRAQLENAADSIDDGKQRRIQHAAEHYLAALDDEPLCRFDAVLVDSGGEIRWLKDAFWARD